MTAQLLVKDLISDLSSVFPEREDFIQALLTAIVARKHICIIGPPGTGKTKLGKTTAAAVEMKLFASLLSKQSTLDDIFGPINAKTYVQTGRAERDTSGYAPEAEIVILDEVFKSNISTLNGLLAFLEEGIVYKPEEIRCPLVTAIGLSNEEPEDDSLSALWDRFAIKMWVGYLQSDSNRLALLKSHRDGRFASINPIGKQSILELQEAADNVTLSDEILRVVVDLSSALKEEGINVGERSLSQALAILQATAALSGDSEVSEDHFGMIPYVWASEREEIPKIQRKIDNTLNAFTKALEAFEDGVKTAAEKAQKAIKRAARMSEQDRVAELGDIISQTTQINGLIRQLKNDSGSLSPAKKAKVENAIDKAKEMLTDIIASKNSLIS